MFVPEDSDTARAILVRLDGETVVKKGDAVVGRSALAVGKRARFLVRVCRSGDRRTFTARVCIREGGKTLIDAVLEVREAVDFLRFYASEARRQFTRPMPLPGPTGEQNELRLHGRGVIAAISPWNFPLAIFTGLTSAPLAAGNAVIAKPAGQTPLIAALAVELMHEAGIPKDVVQLAPGSGRVVGGTLTAHPLLAGVVFTGSTETARMINRTLAERDGPIIPFVAETGGQNAMIVDQLGAARAGDARRHFLGIPERRPALLGLAGSVRPGGRRRRHDQDDRRRDGSAEGRRSVRPRDRCRSGHRRGGEEGAR